MLGAAFLARAVDGMKKGAHGDGYADWGWGLDAPSYAGDIAMISVATLLMAEG